MRNISLFTSIVSSVFFLSACEKTIINRGYIIEPGAFKNIKVGQTAMSVYHSLGAPTMRSSVSSADGSYSWYYVSKMTSKTSFLDPVIVDQKTMVITFDKDGVVKSVTESTYEKPVDSVSDKTATAGKTAGVLGETFAGIGKYMNRYKEQN